MPVTIGNMTSNVNVIDSNKKLLEADKEDIIREAMMRFKAEKHAEEQTREEREIRDRATTPEPF
jgi:hypothetical protein